MDEPLYRLTLMHVSKIWLSLESRDWELETKLTAPETAIERTFLGYFRTSVMFAIISVLIAQLYVLYEPQAKYGYKEIGRPMATVCLCFSIGTIILGVNRTWNHQHAIVSGKAVVGGFEIAILAFGTLAVRPKLYLMTFQLRELKERGLMHMRLEQLTVVFFALLVSVNVVKVKQA